MAMSAEYRSKLQLFALYGDASIWVKNPKQTYKHAMHMNIVEKIGWFIFLLHFTRMFFFVYKVSFLLVYCGINRFNISRQKAVGYHLNPELSFHYAPPIHNIISDAIFC